MATSAMENATVAITGDAIRISVEPSSSSEQPPAVSSTSTATISHSSSDPQLTSLPTIDILPMTTGFARFRHLVRRQLFDPIARNFNEIGKSVSSPMSLHQHSAFTNRELTFLVFTVMLGIIGIALIVAVGVDRSTFLTNLVSPKGGWNYVCLDYNCFKSSALMQKSMNATVSPCDNFYQYACGGWISSQMMSANEQERTVLKTIMQQNIHRLKDVILEDLDQYRDTHWAYEKKVQTYYKACIDQFQSTLISIIANPLVDEIRQMGGWFVTDDSYFNSFNRTRAHANILGHDNLVDVFFYFDIEPLDQQHQYHFITVREDWLLPLPYYLWSRSEMRADYKAFVRKVGELLAKDAPWKINATQVDKRLDTFAADVIEIEQKIANIHKANEIEISSPRPTIKSISQLQIIAPGFRWLYYFKAIFPEADGNQLNSRTQVVVRTPKILKAVSDMVSNISDTTMKRKMNNYLAWRLAYARLPELPYRYNHLWLDWSEKVRGRSFQYQPIWSVCFQRVVNYMSDAVGGLFTRKHFTHYDKAELRMMAESTRLAVINEVKKLPWMDASTKGNATEKLYHVIEKIGFPDHMDTELTMQNALDYLYMEVDFSDDHFLNSQQLRQHLRKQMYQIFTNGRDWFSDWRETPLYSTKASYFYPWNEMIVPAGLLQFPIYSAINPRMYRFQTFGSTAVTLARAYILAINEQGSWFSKFGDYPDDWWSNSTYHNYESMRKCYSDIYAKIETNPVSYEGEPTPQQLDDPDYYAERALTDIGAIRNAFIAYKSEDVQSDPRTQKERVIPGVPAKSRDEYFFLAFAQTKCAIRSDERTAINMALMHWLPEELAVNTALSQVQQFSDVFQCPVGSRMNPAKRCNTIF